MVWFYLSRCVSVAGASVQYGESSLLICIDVCTSERVLFGKSAVLVDHVKFCKQISGEKRKTIKVV